MSIAEKEKVMRNTLSHQQGWFRSARHIGKHSRPRSNTRPSLEELEPRWLLSTTDYFAFAPSGVLVNGYTTVGLSSYDASVGYGWTSSSGMRLIQRSSG